MAIFVLRRDIKSYEGGYDERYFYEREADFATADIYGITDGSVHAGKFTL